MKLTERKDLTGKIESNNSLLWYILWKADFDIFVMSKKFDLFQLEVLSLNGRLTLSDAHSHMSQWFSVAWDQSHSGFLDWHDFSNGWIIATQGAESEVYSVLFNAIDRDNDKYISFKDVIEYCRLALSTVQTISLISIERTVRIIFNQMKRAGPFDVINIQEFTQYTQQHPDSLFGIWIKVLQWKKTFPTVTLVTSPPPPDYSPPIKVKRIRKEIKRSKTTGSQAKEILKKTSDPKISPEKIINVSDTTSIRFMNEQNFDDHLTLLEDD